MRCLDIEIAVAKLFNPRVNLIVPNVSWGMCLHECDMLILSKSGYATEVEIKTSVADLKRDARKPHAHESERIKYLYFAVPEGMLKSEHAEYIPKHAGIITVSIQPGYYGQPEYRANYERAPMTNTVKYCFNDGERLEMARLGAMRIWTLKQKIQELTEAKK